MGSTCNSWYGPDVLLEEPEKCIASITLRITDHMGLRRESSLSFAGSNDLFMRTFLLPCSGNRDLANLYRTLAKRKDQHARGRPFEAQSNIKPKAYFPDELGRLWKSSTMVPTLSPTGICSSNWHGTENNSKTGKSPMP